MPAGQPHPLLRYLRGLVGPSAGAEGADHQLLEEFVARRDECAFAALVQRHGPLVWGVCRRVLRHEADAEDAFQATFLVLAKKAGSIRKRESVRSWLYGVAYRVAARARDTASRRHAPEGAVREEPAADPSLEAASRDLRAVLDDEVSRLPRRYRTAVILCYLEGKTHAEAAHELGCPEGTVTTRLARARERLRGRLLRRGVALSSAGLTAALGPGAGAAPAALAQATVGAALSAAAGQATAAGATPAPAFALMEGVVRQMFRARFTAFVALALTLGCLGTAAAWVGYHTLPGRPEPPAADSGKPPEPAKAAPAKLPVEARLVARKTAYVLDRGGRTPATFRRHLRDEEKKVDDRPAGLPPAPAVDLVLVLRNTSAKEVALTLGGDASTLTLTLKGPGAVSVVSQRSFTEKVVPGVPVKLGPGKSHSWPIPSLSYGKRGVAYRAYWTEPGAYTLSASLMTTEFRAPIVSNPVKLTVADKK